MTARHSAGAYPRYRFPLIQRFSTTGHDAPALVSLRERLGMIKVGAICALGLAGFAMLSGTLPTYAAVPTAQSCAAFTGTYTDDGVTVSSTGESSVTNLKAGDTIVLTATGAQVPEFRDRTANVTLIHGSGTYRVPADSNDLFGIAVSLSAVGSASWSCTPAGTASQSSGIQSFQTAATKAAATVSAQTVVVQIGGAVSDAFSGAGNFFTPSANGVTFNFAADLEKSKIAERADEAFGALAYEKIKSRDAARANDRVWSAWLDLRGTGFESGKATAGFSGSQYNVTGGVGRKLSPDLLVGIVGGLETMRFTSGALGGTIKGDGGSVGAYSGYRLSPTMLLDGALTYTHIDYSAAVGAISGSFGANRLVAAGGITGTYKWGTYKFEPSARFYALWESQESWTDSSGTAQVSRDFSGGMGSLGGRVVSQPISFSGLSLSPYVGLYGDWRYSSDNSVVAGTPIIGIGDGWSARTTAGLRFETLDGKSIALGGELGGLGAEYKVWTGNLRASVSF